MQVIKPDERLNCTTPTVMSTSKLSLMLCTGPTSWGESRIVALVVMKIGLDLCSFLNENCHFERNDAGLSLSWFNSPLAIG